ncbi:MAG TPA: type I phosphomannose isomerase helical insertion domain-containing protein, partial [Chlamydiales bacterium]|nr:type I phosphomannose isomerase helical insertion domain-containing protein [Chlamydiales bacterium]
MAIALTPFTALCGFRPLSEIANYLSATPELASLIPTPVISSFKSNSSLSASSPEAKSALCDVFSLLMIAPAHEVQKQLSSLVGRYKSGCASPEEKDVSEWVVKLNEQFEGDIGVFCVFILNIVKLKPGEAIFL